VAAEVWSVTSFTELRREGLEVERWNRLHPDEAPRVSYVERALGDGVGPVIAATDYMRALPDGIRGFVPAAYHVLGTDGFGRSDLRATLRRFFEVDRQHVAAAALSALVAEGAVDPADAAAAIAGYGIATETEAPWLR
jgi:pyruvate dehydrogenase E1 component